MGSACSADEKHHPDNCCHHNDFDVEYVSPAPTKAESQKHYCVQGIDELKPLWKDDSAPEEYITGFHGNAIQSLDRVFRRGALAIASALNEGTLQLSFQCWKNCVATKHARGAKKSDRIVAKYAARFVSHSAKRILQYCLPVWRELAEANKLRRHGYPPCYAPFKLLKGDVVTVNPDKELVKSLNEGDGSGSRGGWSYDKQAYLGHSGHVVGWDWVGKGVRVRFSDGHWWSFAPEALHIDVAALPPERRKLLNAAEPADED